jgi:hypothetical protein
MKIEIESIDMLPQYVIHNGITYFNAEPINTIENLANAGVENTIADEQQKKRSATHKQLKSAIENAQNIGYKGEEFVNYYLVQKERHGLIDKVIWEANTNAIAPYDFIIEQNGSKIYIDVKSTEGGFSNPIHISYNELLEMEKEKNQYQIYRIYKMSDAKAQLQIMEGLSDFAKEIIKVLEKLPEYVKPDGIALSPNNLSFGKEILIYRMDVQE